MLLCLASFSYASPAIRFDQSTYEISTTGKEEQLDYVFEFTNTGDQELVIEKLSAT